MERNQKWSNISTKKIEMVMDKEEVDPSLKREKQKENSEERGLRWLFSEPVKGGDATRASF